MSAPPPPLPSCYGVDVGATTSSCCDAGGELYRNELGGHSTASLLSISGSERKLGEAAVGCLSSNPKGTVPMVGLVALTPHNSLLTSPLAPHLPFSHHAGEDGFATLSLPYAGSPRAFSSLGALGALLGKMRATTGAPPGSPLAIPLLPSLRASDIIPRLSDAAAIGGWALVAAPSPGEAMGAALARKFPFKSEDAGGAPRILLLADVGHSSTSATVLSLLPPPLLAKGEEAKVSFPNRSFLPGSSPGAALVGVEIDAGEGGSSSMCGNPVYLGGAPASCFLVCVAFETTRVLLNIPSQSVRRNSLRTAKLSHIIVAIDVHAFRVVQSLTCEHL